MRVRHRGAAYGKMAANGARRGQSRRRGMAMDVGTRRLIFALLVLLGAYLVTAVSVALIIFVAVGMWLDI